MYRYQAPEHIPAHEALKAKLMTWLVGRGHEVIANDTVDIAKLHPEFEELAFHIDFITKNDRGPFFWDVKGGYREETGNISLTDAAIRAYSVLPIEVWIATEDGHLASSRFVVINAIKRDNGKRGKPYWLYQTNLSAFTWDS